MSCFEGVYLYFVAVVIFVYVRNGNVINIIIIINTIINSINILIFNIPNILLCLANKDDDDGKINYDITIIKIIMI